MGLTNSQYDEIMRYYQRLQDQDRQEMEERQLEAYGRIPELSLIDEEIGAASTACARRTLEVSDYESAPDIQNLKKQIKELSARRTLLLTKAGYPADYLKPQYHCPDCRDTGYIGQEKCHCFRQAEIELFYTQSNLVSGVKGKDFSSFLLDFYPEDMMDPATGLNARQTAGRALEDCKRFVCEFDQKSDNIFIYGRTGLGKTLLCQCIAKELLDSSHSVIYYSAYQLFEQFADADFGRVDEQQADELRRHLFSCELLIVDDLGTELTNSLVSSQIFQIINERLVRSKSTIISTNLSLKEIGERYSERVLSRISSSYLILKLIGNDIRIH